MTHLPQVLLEELNFANKRNLAACELKNGQQS
jgi:hypothetical protein